MLYYTKIEQAKEPQLYFSLLNSTHDMGMYAKSRDFYKKNESKNEELLCWEDRNVFVDVLKSIQRENTRKT